VNKDDYFGDYDNVKTPLHKNRETQKEKIARARAHTHTYTHTHRERERERGRKTDRQRVSLDGRSVQLVDTPHAVVQTVNAFISWSHHARCTVANC